tara:strand:+ start:19 stop:879 length:861 start_codon:yes stop_codon:yes gene_type:complete
MRFKELEGLSNNQLRKLLAVIILTDGTISKGKGNSRSLKLCTVDYNFEQHELFSFLCKTLYNKKPGNSIYKMKKGDFMESRIYLKRAIDDLLRLSPAYKTSPHKEGIEHYLSLKQPSASFVFNESLEFKQLVFRIWFDFEGSITPSFKVSKKIDKGKYKYYQYSFESQFEISCANPTLVKDLNRLCMEIGLSPKIKKDKRKWSGIAGVKVTKRDEMKRIVKLGPLTNVKVSRHSKRFQGVKKKKICLLIGQIYRDLPLSRHFKNKIEAEEFRKENYDKMLEILGDL